MTERLRWGILSTADINNLMIPAIRKNPRCDLNAIASRDAGKAMKYASKHGISIAYGSYEQLLSDEEIDAVYISLPNSLHHEWCLKAARAGKHVLCEKPLAITVESCREIILEAEKNNIFLQEGFMYRYHPRTCKIKEVVDQNFDQNMNYLYGVFSYFYEDAYGKHPITNYRMTPEMGGGCLWDIGTYVVNFMRYLIGSEPIEVYGSMRNYPGFQVDGLFCGMMRFENSIIAQFQCSYLHPQRTSTEIYGDNCSLTIPHSYCLVWDKSEPVVLTNKDGDTFLEESSANSYEMEVEHFSNCILDKKERDVKLIDALNNIKVVVALHDAARNGCVVKINW